MTLGMALLAAGFGALALVLFGYVGLQLYWPGGWSVDE